MITPQPHSASLRLSVCESQPSRPGQGAYDSQHLSIGRALETANKPPDKGLNSAVGVLPRNYGGSAAAGARSKNVNAL